MSGRLVIVTGPPGAGKSTISRRLSEAWPAEAALHIHSDDLWTYFTKGWIPPWESRSAAQNAVVTDAMAAQAAGIVAAIDTRAVGVAVIELGGGRMRAADAIDPTVGFTELAGLGAPVGPGQPLARVHARDAAAAARAAAAVRAAYRIGTEAPVADPVVAARIGAP